MGVSTPTPGRWWWESKSGGRVRDTLPLPKLLDGIQKELMPRSRRSRQRLLRKIRVNERLNSMIDALNQLSVGGPSGRLAREAMHQKPVGCIAEAPRSSQRVALRHLLSTISRDPVPTTLPSPDAA